MLVNRTTKALISDGDFYRLFPDVSFPYPLADSAIEHLGYATTIEGPQPTLTENQYAQYDGVEEINGQWFTKYSAVDYTEEQIAARLEAWRQATSCTPFQGRMALSDAGLLSQVEAAIASADEKTKIAWEYALVWERLSPMIVTLMTALNISDTQADDMFKAAQQIKA